MVILSLFLQYKLDYLAKINLMESNNEMRYRNDL